MISRVIRISLFYQNSTCFVSAYFLKHHQSSANPKVKLEATDAFAPIATVGFTYDFNDKWFAVGSVSYAHLKNETTITVKDATHGELIKSTADIEINPILAYAGVGYRF